jgi:hypothetical protein
MAGNERQNRKWRPCSSWRYPATQQTTAYECRPIKGLQIPHKAATNISVKIYNRSLSEIYSFFFSTASLATHQRETQTLFVFTATSFDMTPVPLQGASRRTRSNPLIIYNSVTSQMIVDLLSTRQTDWHNTRPLLSSRVGKNPGKTSFT